MACLLRRGLLTALFALAFTTACAPGTEGPTDGGDVTDAGGNNGGDAGNGGGGGGNDTPDAGGGGGGGTDLELGAACTYGSDQCGEGKICTSIFGSGGMPDTSTSACYAACDAPGGACTAAFGLSGTCQQTQDGNVCVAESGNLGPCGNGANAACVMDAPLCLSAPGEIVGVCGRICAPADPTGCSAPAGTPGCGCLENQECSTSPLQVNVGGATPDGVCASPSTVGDTCGPDTTTGALEVCTGDQACVPTAQGATTGTCQLADMGDAGPGTGDGEGTGG